MARFATILSRRDVRIGSALTLLALGLRLLHLATIRDSPLFNHLFIDLRMYDLWAQRIAGGQWVRETPFFLDPLYPYFVGAIYRVFGRSYLAVAVIQSLLVSLAPALLYLETRRWFDESTGIIAGLFAAVYLPGIYWSPLLMKPALSVCLITFALVLFSRALSSNALWKWATAGSLLALAALTRTTLVWVVPVLIVWIVIAARLGEEESPRVSRPRWARAGAFACGVVLVFSFTFAHNVATGEPIVTTGNHGAIFYLGNNADNPDGKFLQMSFLNPRPEFEQADFKAEAERRAGRELSHSAASRFWLGEGWRWIRAQPVDWIAVSWRKLRAFWGIYETPASLDYYVYREYAPVLRLPLPGFGILGPLALIGMLLAVRRPGWPRFLLVYTLAACAAAIAFFVLTRFRMVIVPALCVFAGAGAVELVRRTRAAIRDQHWKPAVVAFVALLAALVFVAIPVRLPQGSLVLRWASRAGLPIRAESTAQAHFNLGVTYASRAKDAEDPAELFALAEEELHKALRLEPIASTWIELGKVQARQEKNREAIESYREAVGLEPGNYRTSHGLGLLLRRVDELSLAVSAFNQAIQIEPRFAPSAVQLGEVLLELGSPDQAAEAFRHALRLDPENHAARRGLASATKP